MNLLNAIESKDSDMPLLAVARVYSKFIEIAKVQNGQLNSFSPLTKEALKKLYAISSAKTKFASVYGKVPEELVYMSFKPEKTILCWKEPGGNRMVMLDQDTQVEVKLPKMLFCVKNKQLKVLCYKGKLSEKTMLYYNPLPNGRLSICLGTLKVVSRDTFEGIINEYRKIYWLSQFTGSIENVNESIKKVFHKKQEHLTYGKFISALR